MRRSGVRKSEKGPDRVNTPYRNGNKHLSNLAASSRDIALRGDCLHGIFLAYLLASFRVFTRSGSLAAAFDQVQLSHLERHIEVQLSGGGENVARRPEVDRRQADFFGAPAPAPATPEHRPTLKPKPERDIKRRSPSSDTGDAPLSNNIDVLAARLSPTELNELVAALPDDALAHVIVATVRQLRHRLAHSGGRGGKGRTSALERSARQLIAELGGQEDDDDGYSG